MSIQINFFAEDNRLEKLSKLGDPLKKLKCIDFEMFRPILEKALEKGRKSNQGRKAYDCVLMFKIVMLQRLYNLSDDAMEYQINDRLSFSRFLGLTISDIVPDAKTIWLFKENLKNYGVQDDLFNRFTEELEKKHLISHTGTIVDATFVEAPRQRNHHDENEQIKQGITPKEWLEKPNKLRQKDVDAMWTKKHDVNYYGYKDHISCDEESKLITNYATTPANVHDSQLFIPLMTEDDTVAKADSAYNTPAIREYAETHKLKLFICQKGYRNKPLTKLQKQQNKKISKKRCRIEHIFATMTESFNGITIRSIGFARATFNIGIMNLLYNMYRYSFLIAPKKKVKVKTKG